MRYLVPPIVIPALLFIGVMAYWLLGPPEVAADHAPASAVSSQSR
jgi:hypothetical protein